jgi:hypothetical protein
LNDFFLVAIVKGKGRLGKSIMSIGSGLSAASLGGKIRGYSI